MRNRSKREKFLSNFLQRANSAEHETFCLGLPIMIQLHLVICTHFNKLKSDANPGTRQCSFCCLARDPAFLISTSLNGGKFNIKSNKSSAGCRGKERLNAILSSGDVFHSEITGEPSNGFLRKVGKSFTFSCDFDNFS